MSRLEEEKKSLIEWIGGLKYPENRDVLESHAADYLDDVLDALREEIADDIAFVGKASAEGRAHRPKFETGGFLNDCEWMEKVAREGRPEGIED